MAFTKRMMLVAALLASLSCLSSAAAQQCISNVPGRCSATQVCPGGQCCSKSGTCGTSLSFCARGYSFFGLTIPGCQSQCNRVAVPGLKVCGSATTSTTKTTTSTTKTTTSTITTQATTSATTPTTTPATTPATTSTSTPATTTKTTTTSTTGATPTTSPAGQCLSTSTTGQCSALQVCPNGFCCSQFGFCGTGPDFCGTGCQSQCNNQAIPGLLPCGSTPTTTTTAATTPSQTTTTSTAATIAPTNFPAPVADARNWVPSPALTNPNFQKDEFGMFESCGWNGMFSFTLDDGPHPTFSDVNLANAASVNAKLSYFWIGENVRDNTAVAARVIAAGHQVGSHTFTHPDLTTLTQAQIKSELDQTEAQITPLLGGNRRPRIFRPPFGSINQQAFDFIQTNYNYKIIFWNLDSNDWQDAQTVSTIMAFYTQNIGNPATNSYIALNHDINNKTTVTLPQVINLARQRGFAQVPMYLCLNDVSYQ